jgi:hypothetical protein
LRAKAAAEPPQSKRFATPPRGRARKPASVLAERVERSSPLPPLGWGEGKAVASQPHSKPGGTTRHFSLQAQGAIRFNAG